MRHLGNEIGGVFVVEIISKSMLELVLAFSLSLLGGQADSSIRCYDRVFHYQFRLSGVFSMQLFYHGLGLELILLVIRLNIVDFGK